MISFLNQMGHEKAPCLILHGNARHTCMIHLSVRFEHIFCNFCVAGALTILLHKSVDVSDKASCLAIAWDRRVQVAQLVESKMKNFREWSLDSTAIGVAWLDDQV